MTAQDDYTVLMDIGDKLVSMIERQPALKRCTCALLTEVQRKKLRLIQFRMTNLAREVEAARTPGLALIEEKRHDG